MKMKKYLSMLISAVMCTSMFAFTGCSNSTDNKNKTADAQTIKLGVLAPTTGKIAVYGQAVENAVKLAVDQYNKNGGVLGKKVEVIVYDTKGDTTESVNAFNRLVNNDKIDALVGPVISPTALAVAPLAVKSNIPMISPTATHLDVTTIGDNIFRACYIDPYQGKVIGEFAADQLSTKKAAIMYDLANDYSIGLAEAFKSAFEAKGGKVVSFEGYSNEEKDFKSILTNIKAENPEVLFIPDFYNTVGLIAKQAREVGITVPMLGGDGWDAVETVAPEAVEGCYFSNHYAKDDPAEVVQNFIKLYQDTYKGETPNALAALGYDATVVMLEGIKKANSLDKAAITEALKKTEIEGVTGKIVFDKDGNPLKSIAMLKLVKGKQVLEGKFGSK